MTHPINLETVLVKVSQALFHLRLLTLEKFLDIQYLKQGTSFQQNLFSTLLEIKVFEHLNEFKPILVGSIPLNLNIRDSDVDIICHYTKKDLFILTLKKYFRLENNFKITESFDADRESISSTFVYKKMKFDIFGQNIPSFDQVAYRLLLAEHELLKRHGDELKVSIIKLKTKGYSTEQAFCTILGLKGDTYTAILQETNMI